MGAEPNREPLFGGRMVTVTDMFTPAVVQRRLQRMAEQRFVLDYLAGPPVPLNRRQRLARAWRTHRDGLREWVALKVAPWLGNGEDW